MHVEGGFSFFVTWLSPLLLPGDQEPSPLLSSVGRQENKGHLFCMWRALGDSIRLPVLHAASAITHRWWFQAQLSLDEHLP